MGSRLVWTAIVVLVAAFALAPVLLSHDVFSYVDYARLGVVHGLDPYVHAPDAVPTDPVYADVTWTEATSAYGPLFTLATYPLAWLPVGLAVAALKAVAALSVLALAALVARLAAWRGVDPLRAAAFVALNPLVLVHVVGGAHNDGLMMLLAMLAVAAVLAAREASAGAALVAAVAIKAAALFLAPFAVLATASPRRVRTFDRYAGESANARWRPLGLLAAGALVAALAIGIAAYFAFGWDWLHAFGLAGENQSRTSHLSIPTTVARLFNSDEEPFRAVALAFYAAALAWLLIWTWRGGDWIRAAGWAAFGLLLATSWLLPWYLIWALPLAAISRDRLLQLLVLTLTAYQLGARIPL
ncbi:MAG TPA: polyprenol phosphomannose-dependent alpha 1,6 mannosyltransferase MptB [Solirubrobacterales bacterium]|nr:polyprenol phosphomannose-dependent alpha 1,6 mannosyltransferase MptB [Solirubrobacterales bacterium]